MNISSETKASIFIFFAFVIFIAIGFVKDYNEYKILLKNPVVISGTVIKKTYAGGKRWDVDYKYEHNDTLYMNSLTFFPFSSEVKKMKKDSSYYVIFSKNNPRFATMISEKYNDSRLMNTDEILDNIGCFSVTRSWIKE